MFVSQKTELVEGHGMYTHYSQLKQAELQSKASATGLMHGLVSVWYSRELVLLTLSPGVNSGIQLSIVALEAQNSYKELYIT